MTGHPPQKWTDAEVVLAKRMRSQGYSYARIDQTLNRRIGSTQQKLTYTTQALPRPTNGSLRAPDSVLAERERRREATDRRDLTAATFGDPPVGYSALDRRRPHLVKPTGRT
jgi:hypothetical protein